MFAFFKKTQYATPAALPNESPSVPFMHKAVPRLLVLLAGIGLASSGALAQSLEGLGQPASGDTWTLTQNSTRHTDITLPTLFSIDGATFSLTLNEAGTYARFVNTTTAPAVLNLTNVTIQYGDQTASGGAIDSTGVNTALTVNTFGTVNFVDNAVTAAAAGSTRNGSVIYADGDILLGTNANANIIVVDGNNTTGTNGVTDGGAVYSQNRNIAIGNPASGVKLSGNTTSGVAAAVYTRERLAPAVAGDAYGSIDINGDQIIVRSNHADIHTGAIYTSNEFFRPDANITIGNDNITTSVFVNLNDANGSAGAIQSASNKVAIYGQSITLDDNHANGWGLTTGMGGSATSNLAGTGSAGAVLSSLGVDIGNTSGNSDVSITNNTAVGRGGAIYTSNPDVINYPNDGNVNITGQTIELGGNTSGDNGTVNYTGYVGYIGGGAVYSNRNITLTGGDIDMSANKAIIGSGGVLEAELNVTITGNLTAVDNHADDAAILVGSMTVTGNGGVIWTGQDVTLNANLANGMEFDSNTAGGDGGAIRAGGHVALNATGGDITFMGNISNSGNGGNAIWYQNSYHGVSSAAETTFNTSTGRTIFFYDTIANNPAYGLLTVSKTNPGVVLFDGSASTDKWSQIYGETAVSGGVFAVRNDAIYGSLAADAGQPDPSTFDAPSGTTVVGGGVGTIKADEFTLDGGTLDISGSRQPTTSSAYSAAGSGTNPANYSTFNVVTSDATSFAGSTIQFNTYLDDASTQASDHLVIDLNSTGALQGVGQVSVTNTNGPGALTSGDGILLIQVDNGTSAPGDFVLSQPVTKGGFEYELGQGLTAATQNNWYLRSKALGAGGGTSNIPTLSDTMLALLALLLVGGAAFALRRKVTSC
ncbi:MAG: IPTL-CTERM sorting domain-containing protein [Betaproteobacteria bacterium]|nr:IPTL-CTERM sorting domain-containing protein [Betaproteobacteria bacterium]